MVTKFYSCQLITDVVINASLATEGNLQSLDYIPGSNFMGIVAAKLYKQLSPVQAYDIFHSGKVSFGDAHICMDNTQSYQLPFAVQMEKSKESVTENQVWIHHHLHSENWPKTRSGVKLQLKQQRLGFFDIHGNHIERPRKSFAIKSAQDRKFRRSKDGAMFGFESLGKNQQFIFSVRFANEDHVQVVHDHLIGQKSVGKSKSAQYGQVCIKEIDPPPQFESNATKNNQLVIYAESNLCFLNQYGQSTFQPSVKAFGLEEHAGQINWNACQIRTYSYSPWNGYRNISDPQRDVILKGSVFVIQLKQSVSLSKLPTQVGEYQSDGLGRVLLNPPFLEADQNGHSKFKWRSPTSKKPKPIASTESSDLAQFLIQQREIGEQETIIGQEIIAFIKAYGKYFQHITSSQWGKVRQLAIRSENMQELNLTLFGTGSPEDKTGLLVNGVAADRYWNKQNGLSLKYLKKTIVKHDELGTKFVAKLATEMAKLKQVKDGSK